MTTTALAPVVADLPEAEYHAHPALSSSGAKAILKAPAIFRWEQEHRRYSKAFDVGTIAHGFVLGTGWPVDIIPTELLASNGAVSTKAAKEFVAESRAAGRVPVVQAEWDRARAMADEVLKHPVAGRLFEQERGAAEVSLFWTDDETGVDCRARLDFLDHQHDGRRTLVTDLKTTSDADHRAFGRTAASFSYELQAAWYLDAVAHARGDVDAAFVHVLVETDAPHLVSVVQLDEPSLDLGRRRAARARAMFRDCTETDLWPGYSTDVESVSLPRWAFIDEERRSA